jgi:hypothetical protein
MRPVGEPARAFGCTNRGGRPTGLCLGASVRYAALAGGNASTE